MIITLSRQYGAGGSEVARLVATGLGWGVVDNEIVDLVASRAGLAPEIIAAQDAGQVTVEQPGVVVNMPFVVWDGGQR